MSEKRYNTLREVHADGITDKNKIRAVYAPMYTQLSGLVKLAVYTSKKYNKTIVLMGEQHTATDLCYNDKHKHRGHIMVTDFLFELLDCHKDVIVKDVYLESSYNPIIFDKFKVDTPEGCFLNINILKLIKIECLRKNSKQELRNCPYPNSRFHSCDIRGKGGDYNKIILYPLYNLVNVYAMLHMYYYFKNINYVKRWYDSIKNTPIPKYKDIQEFIKELYNDLERLKINKQLGKIDDPFVSKTLRDYIDKNIDTLKWMEYDDIDIHNVYKNILLLNKHNIGRDWVHDLGLQKIQDSELSSKLARIGNIFKPIYSSNVHSAIMDGYLMGRVFRTFKDGNKPKNIIIYTGSAHTRNYIDILEQLGFKEEFNRDTYKNPKDKKLCLDMTGFRVEWLL